MSAAELGQGPTTIRLYEEGTGRLLAEITPDSLRQLQDALEEEFPEDHDYWIHPVALDYLFERGVDPWLIDTLREAISTRDGIDILWREEKGEPLTSTG